MSLNVSNLPVMAYANGFTQWHYTTEDDNIESVGYWNGAVDLLVKNDWIQLQSNTGGQVKHSLYVVSYNDGSTVQVSEMLTVQVAA